MMSIVVQNMRSLKTYLYAKGADSVMLKKLSTKNNNLTDKLRQAD